MQADAPSFRVRRKLTARRAGFSLVEICLALGIVAFALVPLVGLLAVGLDSYRNATLRGRASQAVSKIASAIRQGNTTGANTYVAAAPFDANSLTPITWTVASTVPANPGQFTVYFDESGEVTKAPPPAPGAKPAQMVAMVILTPPTTQFDAGKVQIAVAWPAVRPPTYSASAGITFSNPQGHNESTISFLPNSP